MKRLYCLAAGLLAAMTAFSEHAYAEPASNSLIVGFDAAPENLNPLLDSSRAGQILQRHIYDALIYIDPYTFELRPGLAVSWEEVDDRTIEFRLREGVTFHDGSPFDAEDATWTVNYMTRYEEERLALPTRYNWIERAEQVDDYTFRLIANRVNPIRLVRVGFWPMLPSDYYQKVGRDQFSLAPIGTGPYRIADLEPGQRIVLSRYENYYQGGPKGRPAIDTVNIRVIPSAETRVAELIAGSIDWDFTLGLDQAELLRSMPNLKVETGGTFRVGYLQMDAAGRSGNEALQNVLVRRAIAHAIDRETLAKVFWGLEPDGVLRAFCHPTSFGCLQDVPQFNYDPDEARRLLAEAGYADGFAVTLTSSRNIPDIAAIAGYLEDVGLDVTVNVAPLPTVRSMQKEGKLELAYGGYGGSQLGDVEGVFPAFFTFGARDYFRDEKIRDWVKASGRTTDKTARMEIFEQLLPYMAEQMYVLPLNTWSRHYIFASDLDWKPSPDELPRWYLARWPK